MTRVRLQPKIKLDRTRTPSLTRRPREEHLPNLKRTKMIDNTPKSCSTTFSQNTKTAFFQYLHANPNNRRVSQTEKNNLIQWLINLDRRPSSQQEFSRRNYARKSFSWDDNTQSLLKIPSNGTKGRMVVTEDAIASVVELVHNNNGHSGWDATWKDVSTSYYGILRADVIFLLKQCQVCADDPRKRPKGLAVARPEIQLADESTSGVLNFDDFFCLADVPANESIRSVNKDSLVR